MPPLPARRPRIFAVAVALLSCPWNAVAQWTDPVLDNFAWTSVSPADYAAFNLSKPIVAPDFVQCDATYGEGLNRDKCLQALETMPDGLQFKTYASQKKFPMEDVSVTPVYYYDNKDEPSCVITVDLAGRSTESNRVDIRKTTLRALVRHVNSSCVELNFGRGGFVTYHLGRTAIGMANLKKTREGGYDAPLFLTVQVSPTGSRKRPGNTDPRINLALQDALNKMIPSQVAYGKRKIAVIVNALKETIERMVPGGEQSWWDSAHITTQIPDNVNYVCDAEQGRPAPRGCEDASFNFIGKDSVIVDPQKPLSAQAGNCAILVQTRQRHACVYDVIRATVDYLISKCLDGPDAPGIGGRATAEDFFGSNSTMNETSAVSAHLKRQDNAAPKLPPTYTIFVYKVFHGSNSGCDNPIATGNGTVCMSQNFPAPDGPLPPGMTLVASAAGGLPLVPVASAAAGPVGTS